MRLERDEAKRTSNLAKHGIDFALAELFDFANAKVFPDTRRDYGEARYIALGRIEERVHVLVFTWRDETVRVISLRKANDREIESYGKA